MKTVGFFHIPSMSNLQAEATTASAARAEQIGSKTGRRVRTYASLTCRAEAPVRGPRSVNRLRRPF